jgi:hypothetical protein
MGTEKPRQEWTCINCEKSEKDVAIIQFHYAGITAGICTTCLPTLIHHPEQLSSKLPHSTAS